MSDEDKLEAALSKTMDLHKAAEQIVESLGCAECCETSANLATNLIDAQEAAEEVLRGIKALLKKMPSIND